MAADPNKHNSDPVPNRNWIRVLPVPKHKIFIKKTLHFVLPFFKLKKKLVNGNLLKIKAILHALFYHYLMVIFLANDQYREK